MLITQGNKMACVYVLINPAMPGLVKIGYTARTAIVRAVETSQGTGVPVPFKVAWYCETVTEDAAKLLEKRVHKHCAPMRENSSREFFKMTVEQAIGIIESIGQKANVIGRTSSEVEAHARAESIARSELARLAAEKIYEQQVSAMVKREREKRIVHLKRITHEPVIESYVAIVGEVIFKAILFGSIFGLTGGFMLGGVFSYKDRVMLDSGIFGFCIVSMVVGYSHWKNAIARRKIFPKLHEEYIKNQSELTFLLKK
jgi:hypothetical protein